jgi:hypothetical protein
MLEGEGRDARETCPGDPRFLGKGGSDGTCGTGQGGGLADTAEESASREGRIQHGGVSPGRVHTGVITRGYRIDVEGRTTRDCGGLPCPAPTKAAPGIV